MKRKLPFAFFDRAAIILISLLILLLSAVIPALSLASSPAFYHRQFERTGLYATVDAMGHTEYHPIHYIGGEYGRTATFTDAQLDEIADHIIDFCFGDKESFALTMDGVTINGVKEDGVQIFGEEAIVHMADVKALFTLGTVFCYVGSFVLIGLIVYVIWHRYAVRRLLLRYTLGFYLSLLSIAGLFLLVTWIFKEPHRSFTNELWRNLHLLFFAFQPEKIEGSFFSDTLTQILTLDLFMSAVITVVLIILGALALWFFTIFVLRYKTRSESPTAVPISRVHGS